MPVFHTLAWIWLGLAAFFAMLAGMASDGCSDSACDTAVTRSWLVLLAVQAAVLAAGIIAGRRTAGRRLWWIMGTLAVVSPATIALFLAWVGRYV
jgi:hypothetical protein